MKLNLKKHKILWFFCLTLPKSNIYNENNKLGGKDMKIIKRSGKEVDFDQNKITNAIIKANLTVDENEQLTEKQIAKIVDDDGFIPVFDEGDDGLRTNEPGSAGNENTFFHFSVFLSVKRFLRGSFRGILGSLVQAERRDLRQTGALC